MDADVRGALERTKALIERGWCQNQPHDGDKRCLVGALAEATTKVDSDRMSFQVWGDCLRALINCLPDRYENLVRFNDDEKTTQSDVLALIDRALS